MTTVTMNISLTEDLKSFVDMRIKARGYSSTSEYMRDLVRRDEERQAEERFKALIEDGIASGPAGEWGDLREQFLADSGVPTAQGKPAVAKPAAKRNVPRPRKIA